MKSEDLWPRFKAVHELFNCGLELRILGEWSGIRHVTIGKSEEKMKSRKEGMNGIKRTGERFVRQ